MFNLYDGTDKNQVDSRKPGCHEVLSGLCSGKFALSTHFFDLALSTRMLLVEANQFPHFATELMCHCLRDISIETFEVLDFHWLVFFFVYIPRFERPKSRRDSQTLHPR